MATTRAVHLRYDAGATRTACGIPLRNAQYATQHPALVTCRKCRSIHALQPERSVTYMPPPTRHQ